MGAIGDMLAGKIRECKDLRAALARQAEEIERLRAALQDTGRALTTAQQGWHQEWLWRLEAEREAAELADPLAGAREAPDLTLAAGG